MMTNDRDLCERLVDPPYDDTFALRHEAADEIARLRGALRFYAEPWKFKDIDGDDVRIPDFYSELEFGDTARAALADVEQGVKRKPASLLEVGFAPGLYLCLCSICDSRFYGDKRCVICEPCARAALAEQEKK